MSGYKHIETSLARFIAGRYHSALEIGTGRNTHAAELLLRAGVTIMCSDLTVPKDLIFVPYTRLDICTADPAQYHEYECIFAIRPIEEMMRSLIRFASEINVDLYVYHLGFEGYSYPHQIIPGDIQLCRYVTRQS